jgi:hypothetical protein
MALVALYFALPIVANGTQTLGCYLLRLKVTPSEQLDKRYGLAEGFKRVALGFIGLCTWPFMWALGRGKDGSTWYDRATGFRVKLIRYA